MIFSAVVNIHGTVDLFQQNNAHQLMWKRHRRKTQLLIGAAFYGIAKPKRAADDKDKPTAAVCHKISNGCSKRRRGHRLSLNAECGDLGSGRNFFKNALAFLCKNLFCLTRRGRIRRCLVFDLNDRELAIPLQTFGVFSDGRRKIIFFDFSDAYDRNMNHVKTPFGYASALKKPARAGFLLFYPVAAASLGGKIDLDRKIITDTALGHNVTRL